jgi:fibronectin type 3 domain-containing protein
MSSSKPKTNDVRITMAEKERLMIQEINRQALGQTVESTAYRIPGVATISFVNVNTAIGPTQTGGGGGAPDVTPPAQVTGFNVVSTGTSTMSLTWTANTEPDLAGYNVYRGTTPGFSLTVPVGAPNVPDNFFNDTGLSASTTYYYKISARDTTGNIGTPSVEDSATTAASGDVTPPGQTLGLVATSISTSQINLSWTASTASDLNHYDVYRSTVNGFTVNLGVTVPIAQPTSTSFPNTGLTASTTYYYRVSAVDHTGNRGAVSAQASATTSAVTVTPPAQVTGFSATANGQRSNEIFLMWNANTEPDLVQYNVYRGTTPGFSVILGTTVPFRTVAAPSTSDYGGTYSGNTTYYFKVAAVDTGGDIGALSTEASATTPDNTILSTLYMPFNGNLSDFGPNSFLITRYHNSGYTQPGKFGSHAIVFNWPTAAQSPFSVDQIHVDKFTNPTLLQMDPVVGFSVALWIQPKTLAALPQRRVLAEKPDEPTQKWTLQIDSAGIAYFFVMKAGVVYKRQISGIVTNQWQHLAATFNGATNTLEIYRNGVAGVASTATPQFPGSIEGDPANLVYIIGTRVGVGFGDDQAVGNDQTMFQGYMDEFLWYRSYVLSQAEITGLVNSNATHTIGSTPGPVPINANLWLKLDGNYSDASGFGNTVTASNPSGFAGSGQFGTNSVRLNTPTAGLDHISVTNNTNVELDLANGFSYSLWIYPTSSTNNQHIISKRIDANNYIIVWYDGSTGDVSANVMKAGDMDRRIVGTITGLNAWHHVVVTWTSQIMRGYVDITPPPYPPTTSALNTAPTTTNNLIIGNLSGNTTSGSKVFRGRIDEFQYFKSVILGQDEVNNLYNTNSPD